MNIETEPVSTATSRQFAISRRYLILLAILLLATFLRFWRLDSFPPGLHHDEAYNGLDALSLLNRETFPIFYEGWELYSQEVHLNRPIYETSLPVFFEGNLGREPLSIYLSTVPILLWGTTPFAVRFVSASAGVLAVMATYLAANILSKPTRLTKEREKGSPKAVLSNYIPLLAAFMMAVFYPALTYSRVGFRAILFVPIGTFSVYCFWRGIEAAETSGNIETPFPSPIHLGAFKPRWFLIGGVFLGLGFYTYAAARFLPLLFLAYVLIWFWRSRESLRRQWANLLLMAVTAFIIAFPLLIFMIRHPFYLIFRSRVVANRGAGTFPGRPWLTWYFNIGRVLRGLIWEGDENLLHNLPGRPFLDPIQVVLIIAGIVRIVFHRFERRNVFLLLWLAIMLLPGILSGDAPHFGRLLGVASPLVILMAMGAIWLGQIFINWLETRNVKATQYVLIGLMILLLISASIAIFDYYWRYANQSNLSITFDNSDWILGKYAAALPDETTIYLTPNQEEMATIYFALEGQRDRLRSFHSPNDSLLPAGHPGQPAYFFVRTHTPTVLDHLERLFPQGEKKISTPGFSSYWVPAYSDPADNDLSTNISWSGAIALEDWGVELLDNSLFVTLIWQSQVPMSRDYTAYVHLLDQEGTLIGQLDRPPDGYPTSDWTPGEFIQDRYEILLPDSIRPGAYVVQSGFYHLPTNERLGEPLKLGEIEIP